MAIGTIASLAALGIGAAGNLYESFFGENREEKIEQLFENIKQQNLRQIEQEEIRALAESVSGTKSRLSSAGLGGSGVIESAIRDNQNRIREIYSRRKQELLADIDRAKIGHQLQTFQDDRSDLKGLFTGLQNIGAQGFALSQNLFDPLRDRLGQLENLYSGLNQNIMANLPQNRNAITAATNIGLNIGSGF